MKSFLCAVLMIGATAGATAEERIYSGPWKTTNRKLDGVMTCVVTPLAKNKWKGRFFGTWQGVDFDYKVDFQGPPEDLRGTAAIDGVTAVASIHNASGPISPANTTDRSSCCVEQSRRSPQPDAKVHESRDEQRHARAPAREWQPRLTAGREGRRGIVSAGAGVSGGGWAGAAKALLFSGNSEGTSVLSQIGERPINNTPYLHFDRCYVFFLLGQHHPACCNGLINWA